MIFAGYLRVCLYIDLSIKRSEADNLLLKGFACYILGCYYARSFYGSSTQRYKFIFTVIHAAKSVIEYLGLLRHMS